MCFLSWLGRLHKKLPSYFKYRIVLKKIYESMMACLASDNFICHNWHLRKSSNTMMKMYSNDGKTVMILIYGECNKKSSAVARLCRQ
jgi:hypothetical protein